MSFLTANGKDVLAGKITMPRTGAWTADLEVASTRALEGKMALLCETLEWSGTIIGGGVYTDKTLLRVVGGAGGLGKRLSSKAYRNTAASVIIGDILREIGEKLSPTITATLAKNMQWWHRGAETAGEELSSVFAELGLNWRILRDGTIWAGVDAYPIQSFDHTLLENYPDEGRILISSDLPILVPAVTFDNARVARVTHEFATVKVRTEVIFLRDKALTVDFVEGLTAFVRKLLAPTQYLGSYAGRIVSQNADGSLEWVPDDARFAGISYVPIELGIPGSSVKVAPNTRCTIGFRNGKKNQPYVQTWDTGTALEIKFAGGELPIARQGDMVQVISSPPGLPAYGVIMSGRPELKG